MISIIIVIISFILDGILSNFLPYVTNDLSLFTPAFTLVSLFLVSSFYHHKEKNYYILYFIAGLCYDLFYTNLLFFNGFMFLVMGIITVRIHKYFEVDFFKLIIYIPLIIAIYESLSALIFSIFNLVPITLYKLLYKISHTLILNIIYALLVFTIIHFIPKKYKKMSIN